MSKTTEKLLKTIIRSLKGILKAVDQWVDEKGKERDNNPS